MALDLVLAILHHILVFSLVAVLAMELALVRPGMDAATVRRVARIDLHYGMIAGLVIAVGFLRVFFGLKGADFYFANHVFWTKVGLFVLVGVLSVPPTLRYLAWRRNAASDEKNLPGEGEIKGVRRYVVLELVFIVFILIAAAAMARGIGA